MSSTKIFKCYSAKLAGILIRKGFELKKTEPNFIQPQYNVYLFDDSEELRKEFDKYCKSNN